MVIAKKKINVIPAKSGICLFLCLSLLALIAACGRRGDPALIIPSYDEKTLRDEAGKSKEEKKETEEPLIKEDTAGTKETVTARPDAPSDVAAVYTGKGIVLVWKEVLKQGVTAYRVYRSAGEGYELAGETVGPAFTDRDIKKDKEYFYKVTAVGSSESIPSEEITVDTKDE